MIVNYTISKYLIKIFVFWLIMVSLIFIFIFVLFDLAELFRKLPLGSHSTIIIGKMLLFQLLSYFQEMLPFIVFFAAVASFGQLNKNQELVIMSSSMLSIWNILFPLSLCTLAIGVFDLLIINPISSQMLSKYNHLENIYINKNTAPFTVSQNGLWLRQTYDKQSIIINAQYFDLKKKTLYDTNIYLFDKNSKFTTRIDAKYAYLDKNDIKTYNVNVLKKDDYPTFHQMYSIPVAISINSIKNFFEEPKSISFYNLLSYAKLMSNSGLSERYYIMQWHVLLSRCFWLTILLILATTFTMSPVREGKTGLLIITSISLTFILYFLRNIMYALGCAGTLNPIIAAWAPVVVTFIFALTKLLHSEDG